MIRRPPSSTRTVTLFPYTTRVRSRWPELRLVVLATMTAVWAIFGLLVPWLRRPAILLFFIAGILARRGGIEMRVASLPFAVTAFPFMLLASIKIWLSTIDSGFAASHPRSEERSVGKECVLKVRFWWSPYHYKKPSVTTLR